MEEHQREFGFMEELKDRHVLRSYGTVIAVHCLDAMKESLSELIHEEVQEALAKAISKRNAREGCDFVAEELKELVGEAFHLYFEPIQQDFRRIADSYRRDDDDADWWKRGGYDDNED